MNAKNVVSYKVLGLNNIAIGSTSQVDRDSLRVFFEKIQKDVPSLKKNEFFELLNRNGSKTRSIKPRDLVHKEGDLHGAFHFHVFSNNNGGSLLLQKRNDKKDICPGKLDTVAAGHYAIGETVRSGMREVREEIGLRAKFEDAISLGKRINYDPHPEVGIMNFELQNVFLFNSTQPIENYRMQASEVAGIVKVPLLGFIDLMKFKTDIMEKVEALIFNKEGVPFKTQICLTRNDVWPAPFDNYYLKVALVTSLVIEGKSIPKEPLKQDVSQYLV